MPKDERELNVGGMTFRLKEHIPPQDYQAWADANWANLDDGIDGLNHILETPVSIESFPDIDDYLDLHRAISDFFTRRRWARRMPLPS